MKIMDTSLLERFVEYAAGVYKQSNDPEKAALAEDALIQLKPLVELAKTNFAACGNHPTAIVALTERIPLIGGGISGGGAVIQKVASWLYAKATEVVNCTAPLYIHCDRAQEGNICPHDCGCPFAKHTGLFE